MSKHIPTILEAETLSYKEVHELPGDWDSEALRSLLKDLEVELDGVDDSDLLDLVQMALTDLDHHEAGMAVLSAVFGDKMPTGVRSNLVSDLEDDRPWENFADLHFQEGIFTATVLLQLTYPERFGKPDATRATVSLRCPSEEAAKSLVSAPATTILRALAPGLGDRSLVNRLYDDGLRAGPFPEAEHILWQHSQELNPQDPLLVTLEVFGAHSFLAGLDDAQPWQAELDL